MTDFFEHMVACLANAKIDSPRLETRKIFAHVFDKDASQIYSGTTLTDEQKQKIAELVNLRLAHWPLDKIIGCRAFYKSEFITGEDVLSPRPDTEILVEKALALMANHKDINVLDLGTGSGCIILSLLKEYPLWQGTAVDVSASALAVAQKNAQKLAVDKRVTWINDSWFSLQFMQNFSHKFELIVSNPPYIPTADIPNLAPEVKDHDPMLALDGGKDGFDSYKRIAELAKDLLCDNGYILLEGGQGQAEEIAGIFTAHKLKLVEIVCDLAGIKRCVILQKQVA